VSEPPTIPVPRPPLDVTDSGPIRHFIVCGDSPLAYRLAVELRERYDGHVTAIVRPGESVWAERIAAIPGIDVVITDRLDASAFARAHLHSADGLALVNNDDGGNVDAALVAQELAPGIRIVLRMFNVSLAESMERTLDNCQVLSSAAIAAPAFVSAALDDHSSAKISIADRTLVSIRRVRADPRDVVLGLAVMGERGTDPETLPADDTRADLVLAVAKPPARRRVRRKTSRLRGLPIIFGPRLRSVLGVFFLIFLVGSAVLAWSTGASIGNAMYTAAIAELSGNPDTVSGLIPKATLVVLTMVSIALIPALTATLVDALVKARLQREAGGLLDPIKDHIIVVGLGDVGTRVLRELYDQGVDVVAIEKDPEARGVLVARELDVPLIIGDASRTSMLVAASVSTCRALVISSADDVTNLETALKGRAEKPDLRVVLRLFDGEFADRVKNAFNIDISRSVSYLAAPAFAAAMLGRYVIATIPVRRRALLVAELPIGENSPIEGEPAGAVNVERESRLLAIRAGNQVLWRPSDGRPLRSPERLVVITTRHGLGRLTARTATPAQLERAPFGLLKSWQMPHSRTESGEISDDNPAVGPTDAGLPGPA
jgi:Trk K+ transport system NAD-binding subunit